MTAPAIDYRALLVKFIRHVDERVHWENPLACRYDDTFTDEEWAELQEIGKAAGVVDSAATVLEREVAALDRLIRGHEQAFAAESRGMRVVYGPVALYDADELSRLRSERDRKLDELRKEAE